MLSSSFASCFRGLKSDYWVLKGSCCMKVLLLIIVMLGLTACNTPARIGLLDFGASKLAMPPGSASCEPCSQHPQT